MVRLICVNSVNRVHSKIEHPQVSDIETIFTLIFGEWVGRIDMYSTDNWSLVLYVDNGRFHLAVVNDESAAFFAQNSKQDNTEETIEIAWTVVPKSEVLADQDLVRRCLLAFYNESRPYNGVAWKKIVMEG